MILEFDNSFDKSLDKLKNPDIKKRIEQIISELDNLESISDSQKIKKLVGFKSYFRIRIGEYRLGIELKTPNIIRFIVFAHRKDIYKIFP
jgi:mRNA interferase RelE/StbE